LEEEIKMSKILKRPMFRKGGFINEGIVSMAQPRKNYQGGTEYEDIIKMFPEKEESIREGAARSKLMSAFAGSGRSQGDRVSDLLIQGGLNLMSARPRGNIFSTAAESFKEPTSQFLKEKQAEDAFQRQIRLGGITGAISQKDILAQLEAKAKKQATSRLPGDPREARLRIIQEDAKFFQNNRGMVPGVAKTIAAFEFDVKNGNISGLSGEQIDSSKPFIRSGDIDKSGKLSKNAELDYYDAGKIYVEPSSGIIFRFDGPEQGFKAVARTEVYKN
jgi:hypothetical protein